jgi:anti-sigma regulatory factor (Ser/Thr protein kinase)
VQTDRIKLAVPAMPEYVRLARLTAAGLASRIGFSYDDVEDLRIAVDELCYLLVGSEGRPGSITLTYFLDDDGLVVEGEGAGGGRAELAELAEQILAALVDEYEIVRNDETVTFRMARRRRG